MDAAAVASSAGLVALTRTAQTAAAAVSAVGRVPAKAAEPKAAEMVTVADQTLPAAPSVTALEAAATPVPSGGEQVAPEPETQMRPEAKVFAEPASEPAQSAEAPSAAPIPDRPSEQVSRGAEDDRARLTPVIVAREASLPASAPIKQAETANAPYAAAVADENVPTLKANVAAVERVADAPARSAARADPGEIRANASRVGPLGVSAPDVPTRVRRETTDAAEMVSRSTPVSVERGQAPSAPMAGLFAEQASAPRPDSDGHGDGGGGAVVLDGRMVGQWLSERMARDAARPSAGPTFFDPRQAPAWTPSGVL